MLSLRESLVIYTIHSVARMFIERLIEKKKT